VFSLPPETKCNQYLIPPAQKQLLLAPPVLKLKLLVGGAKSGCNDFKTIIISIVTFNSF
jgi:hypothetical protein